MHVLISDSSKLLHSSSWCYERCIASLPAIATVQLFIKLIIQLK